jgi:hypothetical protein
VPSADRIASALLRPHIPHLQERWRAGCTTAAQLFREITARGYGGSKTLLTEAVRAWRPPRGPRRRRRRVRLRWLCLRPPAGLRPDEQAALQAALAALGEPDGAITRLYFGLEGGRTWTARELAARFGLNKRAVQETVARSVARLLPQP